VQANSLIQRPDIETAQPKPKGSHNIIIAIPTQMDDIIDDNKIRVQEINNLPIEESNVKSSKIAIIINKEILF